MYRPAPLIACTLFCLLSPPVASAQDTLNDLIQPEAAPVDALAPDVSGTPELWTRRTAVRDNLRILTLRPGRLASSCQDLLFELGEPAFEGFDIPAESALQIDLPDLCFLGFRNTSDNRTLLIKLDDKFRSISILPDSRLIDGLALGPSDEILAPVRISELDDFDFQVDIIWEDQRDDESVDPDSFMIHLNRE